MAKKYTLELTEEQMRVTQNALEEWFRMRMGQDYSLSEDLTFGRMSREGDEKTKEKNFDRALHKRDAMHEILLAYFKIAFGPFGVPNEKGDDEMIAECIWDAIRCARGVSRYPGPMQIGKEPCPEIKVTEE